MPASTTDSLTIRRPDDWHVHFRDGTMLQAVAPATARQFARAIVMPNLSPPVTDVAAATAYRERIAAAVPGGLDFTPLMTCYLTDATDPAEVVRGYEAGVFTACKLYPANATTNSAHGVTTITAIYSVLEAMQAIGMPLLVHGEVTDADIDIFDREAVFIDRVLVPLLKDFPALKVVLEHITTAEAAAFVLDHPTRIGATVTPQHLIINRNAIFAGGLRPHAYCLPVAKREQHRLALRKAATSGSAKFFLGTDTAPHPRRAKEAACGCAGIFHGSIALQCYAQAFAEEGALCRLEAFAALNGAHFHGLAPNEGTVTLAERPAEPPKPLDLGEDEIVVFREGETLPWSLLR